ncbi:serine hydrolase-like protein 2 isoform X2 [Pteronotus mesoamericanus]|uniref:serine hydrolase-like protein 2 isoform X2 n=1 Tax=Pteronotus mesoamericanus TaxID=1884717 RepID=UPI0023ED91A5|nr:serine hydrolase-like protein 2 isoform X2 [Pteronotus parnellii mesoamericanus]
MGLFSELKLAVPWGHIAAKAWGSPKGRPVLCLHGWLDNANSFDRLIPLLPRDLYYVAMDFRGHGLSSHFGPGLCCHFQNFVSETRRVVEALKWKRFSILGHSFGGFVGGMFSCVFPEMVDELIMLDSLPFALDTNEVDNLLTYKRKAIEHTLQLDAAAKKPPRVLSLEETLQRLLKANTQLGEECGKILLQRGTTRVATGVVMNRDRRMDLMNSRQVLPTTEAHTLRSVFCMLTQGPELVAVPASGVVKVPGGKAVLRERPCRAPGLTHVTLQAAMCSSIAWNSSAENGLSSSSRSCRPVSSSSKHCKDITM